MNRRTFRKTSTLKKAPNTFASRWGWLSRDIPGNTRCWQLPVSSLPDTKPSLHTKSYNWIKKRSRVEKSQTYVRIQKAWRHVCFVIHVFNPQHTKLGYCNSVVVSLSAKAKWRLYRAERSSKSVGLSIHKDSFRAKNVANRCLHCGTSEKKGRIVRKQTIIWVSDKSTAYIKEGQVQEYGTLGAASRSRRVVYVAVDPRTSYSVCPQGVIRRITREKRKKSMKEKFSFSFPKHRDFKLTTSTVNQIQSSDKEVLWKDDLKFHQWIIGNLNKAELDDDEFMNLDDIRSLCSSRTDSMIFFARVHKCI